MELDRFYPGILAQNEKDVSFLGLVDPRVVIVHLCELFGVTIKNVAWKQFFKSLNAKESFSFLETDIDSITAKTHVRRSFEKQIFKTKQNNQTNKYRILTCIIFMMLFIVF